MAATIFQRISLILRSNVNDLLSRYEDPEKIIDQCIIDAKREYAKMLDDVASVKGNLASEKKKLQKLQDSNKEWQSIARKAVGKGNDDDARKALAKAAADESSLTSQTAVVENCEIATAEAEASLKSFADQISAMELKKGELKSKAVAARSQQKANEIKSSSLASSLSTFNEMAERIDTNIETQKAKAELTGADAKADEDLKAKYAAPDVEDALAELKREMGVE